jgi:glycosyl hydrolase family 43
VRQSLDVLVTMSALKRTRKWIALLAALPFTPALPSVAEAQATPVRKDVQALPQKTAGAVEGSKGKVTSGNPVFPGWYADPEVAVFNKRYWIYPTYSAPYDRQVFLDAFSSPDLVNWTRHPRIIDTAAVTWARRAMWAPSVIAKDGKYFLFFSANDIQNDEQIGGIGVAVADTPSGPFKDYLGKPLLDKFHNRAQPIDR